MDLWIVFDWVLMAFFAFSGFIKVTGKERKQAAQIGVTNYNLIIILGALQFVSIYLIYIQSFLLVLIVNGVPYLMVAVLAFKRKEYTATAVLIGLTAFMATRWLTFVPSV